MRALAEYAARPVWASYRSLALDERHQVKESRSGRELSFHCKRHNPVVIGNDEKVVRETGVGQCVPVGTPHRLANSDKIPLRLIEAFVLPARSIPAARRPGALRGEQQGNGSGKGRRARNQMPICRINLAAL